MNVYKHFVLLLCIAIHLAGAPSEATYTSQSAPAIELYKQASAHCVKKDYDAAIASLRQAIRKDKKFVEAYLKWAAIQQQLGDFEGVIKLLNRAQRHWPPSNQNNVLRYELALRYYRAGAYPQAQAVLAQLPAPNALAAPLRTQLECLHKNVAFALEQTQTPVPFHPKLLAAPLNQLTSQYFPVLTVDQQTLFFTARSDQAQGKENIYVSHRDDAGHWTEPQPFAGRIGTTHNEGSCTVSADGKKMVFTACSCSDNCGICDLYITYRQGDTWTKPINMGPRINSHGWESQPSLSADGKTLYFVSERAGNYGKKDIWQSTQQENGEWADPVNLGPIINSTGREISPFMHPNGQTLFFASDRCPSMGGFDIYYSNWIDGAWTPPVNLGYPINGHKDQTALFITADGKKGYYADGSQKGSSYHSSHLYEFDFPPHLLQFPKSDWVRIKVADDSTGVATAAQVEVYDLTTATQQSSVQVDPEDGEAVIVVNEGKDYGLFVKKEGYLFESIHVDYKNHTPPTVAASAPIQLKPIALDQVQVLKNIFFGFDQYTLEARSTTELDYLVAFLQEHPNLCIAIEGHTDHIGDTAYNNQLSIKRAQAIYNYLLAAGVEITRLTYQGYGATRPIAPQDTAEGRQRNRRVAFSVVGM